MFENLLESMMPDMKEKIMRVVAFADNLDKRLDGDLTTIRADLEAQETRMAARLVDAETSMKARIVELENNIVALMERMEGERNGGNTNGGTGT